MNKTTDLAELGDGVYVNAEALIDGRALVQANSGGGKSYAIRKLCEILFGAAQIIVIDVEGEFYTLREKNDYVLFGPAGDYPATVKAAPIMARRLLELGSSAVIDIYELGAKRAIFIARFLEAIMAAPRELWHDVIIIVDEANKYCPEGGQRDKMTEDSANAIVDLMTRGRKRGYCGILATQRLSALDKNAAAECNNVLIGRCNLDVDIARAAKMIGMKPAQAGEILPDLAQGQFYAMGSAITNDWSTNRVARIKIGQVTTTHPKRGQKVPVPPPASKVKQVLGQLKDLEEAAEIDLATIEGANKQVAYWMGEYQRLKNVADTKTAETNEHFANEYRDAWQASQRELEEVKEELEGVRAEESARTFAILERAKHIGILVAESAGSIAGQLANLATWPTPVQKTIKQPTVVKNLPAALVPDAIAMAQHRRVTTKIGAPPIPPKPVAASLVLARDRHGEVFSLAPAQQRILDTMRLLERLRIEYDPMTFGAYYGKHPRNKALLNNLGVLRTCGLVEEWALTDAGRRAAREIPIPSQDVLRQQLLAPLSPAQRRIMDALLEQPEGYAGVEGLAFAVGIHPRNKAFLNNLGALRTRQLVTKGKPVKAGRVLFMDGS